MRAALVRRLWPGSLAGRMVTILLLTLAAAHALTLAWLMGGRIELGRSLMLDYLGPDVALSVATLERLPAADRPNWLPRLARPNYEYRLAPPPAVARVDTSAPAQRIAALLAAEIAPARVVAVLQDPTAAQARLIHLRLSDGQALSLSLQPLRAGVPAAAIAVVALQFGLFALAAWACVRLATRPLRRLAAAADALDPDRPGLPLPETGPVELVRAAQAFNAMQQRMATHLAERARILAAVSHDLQTPITRMRLRAELSEDPRLRERLLDDLDQMQQLVAQGIAYARSAHAALEPLCRVDLQALLDGLACDYADAGERVSLQPNVGLPPWSLRPQTLRRLLGNLVDNALKFAGAAELSAAAGPAGLVITVADRGPGIPAGRIAEMRQPFQRLEASRNRATGGSGLGLAIADQLAAALGGRLALAPRPGGGLLAELHLPAAPD